MSGQKIRIAIAGLHFGAEFVPIYQHHPGVEGFRDCELLDFARLHWSRLTAVERREVRMAQAGHRSVVPVAVFIAALATSGSSLQPIGVAAEVVVLLQGLIFLSVTAGEFVGTNRVRVVRRSPARATAGRGAAPAAVGDAPVVIGPVSEASR